MKQRGRILAPRPKQWNVHSNQCIHKGIEPNAIECGQPTSTDSPHGWLCADHQEFVHGRVKTQAQ